MCVAWFDAALPDRLQAGTAAGAEPSRSGGSIWGPGIRIYLAFDGTKLIILLRGGTKSRQQADIVQTIERWPTTSTARKRSPVEAFAAGEADTGKALIRNYINATVGFDKLGAAVSISPARTRSATPRAEMTPSCRRAQVPPR